ncbi:MAG: SDR family NAD(P)-dependent oxidoreductase [Alphaproteobacteria bacterium]|jgi:hypothetical protein|nr:short-chain dehydrogenase [Rhodospirillaceae bacterium]MDP6406947.1 SDR family NAD(P)-dependent oxidoreductase [Alphaproteobacteria bacterium]MDP6623021.1 SDR family NAD(P)-dependent oxidoreductase [Alphaproteobacteria bacterium]
MNEAVLRAGRVAVVTGAGNGIGRAACRRFAELGMKVCLADVIEDDLAEAAAEVAELAPGGSADVLAQLTDVSRLADIESLHEAVLGRFGEVGLLMNNAATRASGDALGEAAAWQQSISVNMWGVIHGVQTFVPAMIAQGTPCRVVITGSKQGMTNPPGNTPYNVGKAALKAYAECLQHELRNTADCQVTAHLLVPGWTTTGKREHKPGAWLPEQVVEVLEAGLRSGDFYLVCADNEVTPEMDRKRLLWAAGDVIENRPPLSRWHPDYAQAFEEFSP